MGATLRNRTTPKTKRVELGHIVYVTYLDHVFFQNSDASRQTPRTLEAVGCLDYQDGQFIRLTWEHSDEPDSAGRTIVRSTGLVILKSAIVELREAKSRLSLG